MTGSAASRRARAPMAGALAALVAFTLSGCGGADDRADAGATSASSTSPAPLPSAEDVGSTGAQTFEVRPFPDFALAMDGVIWVSGAGPGIVGYDAATGEQRAAVPTGDIYLAMEAGHGALWAAEATGGQYPDTLLRIDPVSGAVTARIPAPEPGLKPESSLAVTDTAVWALVGRYEDPEDRSLASFDPVAGQLLDVVPAPRGASSVRGGHGSLWISTADGEVVRVDPADGSVVATIPTGRGAGFLTVTEDAVWVLNGAEGTVSHIDPATNEAVATVTVSDGAVQGGDIAAGEGSVWVRTTGDLAVEVDPEADRVVRVLGPPAGSGSIAVAEGFVWITVHDTFEVHRVPVG